MSIALGVATLSIVAGATPALAFWTADAQSNNLTVSARAVQLGPFPTGSLTSARPKKTPSFTVSNTAPAGLAGYHVTLVTSADATSGGDPVCDITGATGSCTSPTDYDGGRIFLITAYAGPWSARAAVCTYHDANDQNVTCS
jgi:hypothetical protein